MSTDSTTPPPTDSKPKKSCVKNIALFTLLLLLIVSGFAYRHHLHSKSPKPHVALIIIDTLRADKLGIYGQTAPTSPELDRIAQQGTYFKSAYSQASWTRPSIGSFLTSIHPRTLGLGKMLWDGLKPEFKTFAEVFKENGYSTMGITANPNINTIFHFDQGFDKYIESTEVYDWMREKVKTDAPSIRNFRTPTASIFGKALEMAQASDPSKPGYVQINIMEVHAWARVPWNRVEPEFKTQPNGQYLHTVRVASRETGKFIKKLSAIPGWEDTLFIITSDHGEGLDNHPTVFDSEKHGNLLYEPEVHVPLILYRRADPTLKGKVVTQPVRLLEMMPTVLDYLGIQAPKEVQGVSTLPLIKGSAEKVNIPEYFVVETYWKPDVNKIAVYHDNWKYIVNRDQWKGVPPIELQKMGEWENGAETDESKNNPEVVKSLAEMLAQWEKEYGPIKNDQDDSNKPKDSEIEQLKSLGYLN